MFLFGKSAQTELWNACCDGLRGKDRVILDVGLGRTIELEQGLKSCLIKDALGPSSLCTIRQGSAIVENTGTGKPARKLKRGQMRTLTVQITNGRQRFI